MAVFDDKNLKKIEGYANDAQKFLNQADPLNQKNNFGPDGFSIPPTPTADGNGLPYSKVNTDRVGQLTRNIVTWFVPEFGIIKMYINPNQIQYNFKKIIQRDRTKGGYTLQYWGEDLTTLTIQGTTGSSGIEGINLLYEIYRAEQYAFDTAGLVMAASNSSSQNLTNALGTAIGGDAGSVLFGGMGQGNGVIGGLMGLDFPASSLTANNFTSLAKLAFSVEMYYNGWIYRGFFDNMTINEYADNFLLNYSLGFTATQKRGYRVNYFPWARSPKDGPSRIDTPWSYSQMAKVGGK
jgi:hypothetical protein